VARDGRERWAAVLQRSRGQSRVPEEEEGGRGPRDFLEICKNLRDLTIN
jgi:hypothetical protein